MGSIPDPLAQQSLARGARLTVDLGAIADNFTAIAQRVAPAAVAAVVKADAYGLGLDRVAPALAAAGARTFFTALPEEAAQLRHLLPEAEIGVLDGLLAGAEGDYAGLGLTPLLNEPGEIARWQALARRLGRTLPAMLHVDTGMNRLGLDEAAVAALAAAPERLNGIEVTAVLSHFACADEAGHPLTARQAERFAAARRRLPPARASLANSSGLFRNTAWHLDLVRPGIALYGGNPLPEQANPMAPVVRLEAQIRQVRRVDSPETVGYGATHPIAGPTKIATISIGYADGYRRALGGRAVVRLGGQACPVVGRISMDLTTIDVSRVGDDLARPGAWVELIGRDHGIDDLAAAADTIGYEILTGLGRRFERRYLDPPAR